MEGTVRTVGIILVALGSISLGWQGFSCVTTEKRGDDSDPVRYEKEHTVWVPPLVGGIAVVSGLILLASNGRHEDT